MTGGGSQFARVLATLTPITTRCVTPDFDAIQTCSDEEWEALMSARYGADFETRDFDADHNTNHN